MLSTKLLLHYEWDRRLSETGSVVKTSKYIKRRGGTHEKSFLCNYARWFAQQAGNCTFPTPHFMTLHTNVYVACLRAYKLQLWQRIKPADRNSRRDFVGKCCRKLTVARFSWTLYVVFSWDDIPFNAVVNNHNCKIWRSQPLKKLSYKRGTRRRFNAWYGTTKDVIVETFCLSGSNCDKPFIPGHVRTLQSATVALWCVSPAGWSTPTFWKYGITF
jgi:hypothetical protein